MFAPEFYFFQLGNSTPRTMVSGRGSVIYNLVFIIIIIIIKQMSEIIVRNVLAVCASIASEAT